MNFLQHPIFPLIMTVFTFFIIIIQSIQSEQLLKKRFFLATINIAVAAVIMAAFNTYVKGDQLYEQIYTYYTLFIYFVYFVVFLSSFRTSTLKANHYQLFVKSIKESNWNAYYVVDKRERIKDISQSMLDEINFEKDEVIGKKLFNIFNKSVRYTQLNGTEVNNRQLEHYYNEYRKTAKIGDSEVQELVMLNSEGVEVVFKQIMQPVFVLGKYRGRVIVGEKKTDFDLLDVEKNLNSKTQELESIQQKFIATLEISQEGLFSIDLDERVLWASDALVENLNLASSTNDLSDFRELIHPDDLKEYLAKIGELSITRNQYLIKYRILKDGSYIWVEERGKRIFEDKTTASIMGTLNEINNHHFRKTEIDLLDELQDYSHLLAKMNTLIENDKYFYMVLINLTNIPNLNEEHGWNVGNMIIAMYLNKIDTTFVTENGGIYRISGLKFAVLVTNPNKMNLILNGSQTKKDFLNLPMQYGSINVELEVNAGVAISKQDANIPEKLYKASEQALHLAKNINYDNNIVFYSDINE